MRRAVLVVALAALSACTSPAVTEVNGFKVKVEQVDRDPPTWRAEGATRRDRAELDGAYYARNVIAIRNVSGCPVRPDLIRHDRDAAQTRAVVVC